MGRASIRPTPRRAACGPMMRLFLMPVLQAAASDYRITITGTRGPDDKGVQLSELQLFDASGLMAVASATNPAGSNSNFAQSPGMLLDGDTGTKWFDGNFEANGQSVLELTLADSSQTATRVRFVTANDVDKRDPVAWTAEARNNCGGWAVVGSWSGVSAPTARKTPYEGDFSFDSTPVLADCDDSDTYRVVFTGMRGPNPNGMQIAEVELFDATGTQLVVIDASSPGSSPNFAQLASSAADGELTPRPPPPPRFSRATAGPATRTGRTSALTLCA